VSDHPRIDVTVDAVALIEVDGQLRALVVRRGNPPYEGQWALPGGYLEVDEDLAPAAARELKEETGVELDPGELRQLGTYGAPDRDPRGRTISVAFLAELEGEVDAAAGSDAADAQWRSVEELLSEDRLAFDHAQILRDALAARSHRCPEPERPSGPGNQGH
jgi:8-oxo-dGTP diphosphatase